jgi:hypothetical protein
MEEQEGKITISKDEYEELVRKANILDKRNETSKKYYHEHKEENLPKINERTNNWQKNNRELINERRRDYFRQYRLKKKLETMTSPS